MTFHGKGCGTNVLSICRYGGVGRRRGLKIPFRKDCGFESHYRHFVICVEVIKLWMVRVSVIC